MENNSDLIAKLKLIGLLMNGDKINTKYMVVQPAGFTTKVSRTFYKDDRQDTLDFLISTIQKSFDLLATQIDIKKDKNALCNIFSINIVKDLKKSIEGLQHLKYTYDDDKLFICKIDFLIEDTEAKIQDFIFQNKKIFNDVIFSEVQDIDTKTIQQLTNTNVLEKKESSMETPLIQRVEHEKPKPSGLKSIISKQLD
jgi:hypothetical protein